MIHIECVFEKTTMLRERNDPRFTVAFDMDNTLVDDFGAKVRPGAPEALRRLLESGTKLVVWTNSEGRRAKDIMKTRGLEQYFYALVTRESYMLGELEERRPDFYGKVADGFKREVEFQKKFESGKNISLLGYDVLVDDNPAVRGEAAFWGGAYSVEVCERYSGRAALTNPAQLDAIAGRIIKIAHPSLLEKLGLKKR